MKKYKTKLFSLDEHKSCFNYSTPVQVGFKQQNLHEDMIHEEVVAKDTILFLLRGNLKVYCNAHTTTLVKNEMVFLPRQCVCKVESLSDCDIVIAQFEKLISVCTKFHMTRLSLFRNRKNFVFKAHSIKKPLLPFFASIQSYLDMGANCFHLHEIKLRELFWLLRFFYTDLELVDLFYSLLETNHQTQLRFVVLDNWKVNRNIKELAALCSMSESTFRRHFVKEFNLPIGKWIDKNLRESIIHLLSDSANTINMVAEELHFSSPGHFTFYCKKSFGCTPSELKIKIKGKSIGLPLK